MANISTTELLFLFDAASYALYTGNRALGQLSSTLIDSSLYGERHATHPACVPLTFCIEVY